jgi:hypothetical protein
MLIIPSGGLKGGRAIQDRLDSRKSRAVRSIAVFEIFLDRAPKADFDHPPSDRNSAILWEKPETNGP